MSEKDKRTTEEVLEEVAREGAAAMKAYLSYQGNNPEYHKKAKVGGAAVQGFTRLVAANTNRQAIQLMRERQTKALPVAVGDAE